MIVIHNIFCVCVLCLCNISVAPIMIFFINYLHIQAKKRFCDSSDCAIAALVFILSLLYLYNSKWELT